MNNPAFEEIEHTADWALQVSGADFSALLQNAAQGMLKLIHAEAGTGPGEKKVIRLQASDPESLLVTWLEELLFFIEVHNVTFTSFDVQADGYTQLTAVVNEVPLQRVEKEIKAVTYHNLKIQKNQGGFTTTIVFDV
jgi:SHS2 domain-containing protein